VHEQIQILNRLGGGPLEQIVNGEPDHRLPGNLNLSFHYVEGESLLMGIDDIAVSSGSACTSASLEPSHVLRSMGVGDDLAHSSIRFGIGRFTFLSESLSFGPELTLIVAHGPDPLVLIPQLTWGLRWSPARR